jgi:hypothetical protein
MATAVAPAKARESLKLLDNSSTLAAAIPVKGTDQFRIAATAEAINKDGIIVVDPSHSKSVDGLNAALKEDFLQKLEGVQVTSIQNLGHLAKLKGYEYAEARQDKAMGGAYDTETLVDPFYVDDKHDDKFGRDFFKRLGASGIDIRGKREGSKETETLGMQLWYPVAKELAALEKAGVTSYVPPVVESYEPSKKELKAAMERVPDGKHRYMPIDQEFKRIKEGTGVLELKDPNALIDYFLHGSKMVNWPNLAATVASKLNAPITTDDCMHLYDLVVSDPALRGKGIGRMTQSIGNQMALEGHPSENATLIGFVDPRYSAPSLVAALRAGRVFTQWSEFSHDGPHESVITANVKGMSLTPVEGAATYDYRKASAEPEKFATWVVDQLKSIPQNSRQIIAFDKDRGVVTLSVADSVSSQIEKLTQDQILNRVSKAPEPYLTRSLLKRFVETRDPKDLEILGVSIGGQLTLTYNKEISQKAIKETDIALRKMLSQGNLEPELRDRIRSVLCASTSCRKDKNNIKPRGLLEKNFLSQSDNVVVLKKENISTDAKGVRSIQIGSERVVLSDKNSTQDRFGRTVLKLPDLTAIRKPEAFDKYVKQLEALYDAEGRQTQKARLGALICGAYYANKKEYCENPEYQKVIQKIMIDGFSSRNAEMQRLGERSLCHFEDVLDKGDAALTKTMAIIKNPNVSAWAVQQLLVWAVEHQNDGNPAFLNSLRTALQNDSGVIFNKSAREAFEAMDEKKNPVILQ